MMNQPQEKPRRGVVRETPEKRLRILVVNNDNAPLLKSAFAPVRSTVSLEITPDDVASVDALSDWLEMLETIGRIFVYDHRAAAPHSAHSTHAAIAAA